MAKKQRHVRSTLLIVGEGDSEEAFLKHLRSLYCSSGEGVVATVRNAHGKGPENVIDFAKRQARIGEYRKLVALLDTDIPWTDALKKEARKARIVMIGSVPCFEGLLLSILGHRPAGQCAECKLSVKKMLGLDLTETQQYSGRFSKSVLEAARMNLPELDRLLRFFEGI